MRGHASLIRPSGWPGGIFRAFRLSFWCQWLGLGCQEFLQYQKLQYFTTKDRSSRFQECRFRHPEPYKEAARLNCQLDRWRELNRIRSL
jgi:hypothetical protein